MCFINDAYYLLFSLLLTGIWDLSHHFAAKPLLMHTSDLHSAKCYVQYTVLALFDLPENFTEANILLYMLPSLRFRKRRGSSCRTAA